jgi:hypothetical protein
VRISAADGVNETTVDVAGIIKMAKEFKTVVWDGKKPGGGKEGLERYVFFIEYFFACMPMIYVIRMIPILNQGGAVVGRLSYCGASVHIVACGEQRVWGRVVSFVA